MRDDADHIIRALGGMREEGSVDLIDHSTTGLRGREEVVEVSVDGSAIVV